MGAPATKPAPAAPATTATPAKPAPPAPAAAPATAAPAQTAKPAAAPAAAHPAARNIKKGEMLFKEGETSRSMYLVKSGLIRIFKDKGDSQIEIDTVRSGQILGELAFLDGNPRSASAQALTDVQMVEISGPAFFAVLQGMPDWLKIMLKTVVGRLRTANTRVRQLETASSTYDYSDKDGGKRASHYVYLSPSDVMKSFTALLLVASKYGKPGEGGRGIELSFNHIQRFANQIMQVPMAKVASILDLLGQIGVAHVIEDGGNTRATLLDIAFLESLTNYMNDENLADPTKRHDLGVKSYVIMGYIAKHLTKFGKDPSGEYIVVNMAEIRRLETPVAPAGSSAATVKEPFRMDDFGELVKLGYATNIDVKSPDEIFTKIVADKFMQAFRLQRAIMAIAAINEQKSKATPK